MVAKILLLCTELMRARPDPSSLSEGAGLQTSMDKLVIHPISHIPLPVLVTTLATNLLLSGFMKLREG